jgi:hypothetical protein
MSALPAFAIDPSIRWEIQNRFRYFKKASDFRAIAKVYDGLKTPTNLKPTALQLERALETEVIQGNFNGLTGSDTLDGWAASIFENTCGREASHTHATCRTENGDRYREPVTADLVLSADGLTADTCEWRIDNTVLDTLPCNKGSSRKKVGKSRDMMSI